MSAGHSDIGPELRQLAQAILDRLDPALRSIAAMAADSSRAPGRCQQVWCPVCALAALASGEQHPMLNVIAEHSVALMAVIKTMAADPQSPAPGGQPTAPEQRDAAPEQSDGKHNANGRYQPIPIVVEPGAEE